jgi:hypothetical protein
VLADFKILRCAQNNLSVERALDHSSKYAEALSLLGMDSRLRENDMRRLIPQVLPLILSGSGNEISTNFWGDGNFEIYTCPFDE